MSIFAVLLFMLFLYLDAASVIDWSTAWITAPLWGYLILAVCMVIEAAASRGLRKDV